MSKEVIRKSIEANALSLIEKYNNIVLEYATGVGKSKIAIDMLDRLVKNINSLRPFLIVVAETAHKDNWYKEFVKWGKLELWNKCDIVTYNSLHKISIPYYCIIFDEAHHLCTDLRIDVLMDRISSTYNIFLSATLGKDKLNILREIYSDIYVSRLTLRKSIDLGVLPDPKVYAIPLELDNTERNEIFIFRFGKGKNKRIVECSYPERFKYSKEDVIVHAKCTQYEKYLEISRLIDFWRKRFMLTKQPFMKTKWMAAATERKRFLGEIKTEKVLPFLLSHIKDRWICFCNSKQQQNDISYCTKDSYSVINSDIKDVKTIIARYNMETYRHLYCVGMLQEGQNLVNTPMGIIIQLDNESRRFIQKVGRILRADNPEIYVFYFKNTRDEEYLDKIKEMLPDKVKQFNI